MSYRIEKAQNAVDEAEKVSAIGLWNIVANRLYYALFYAATAILIKKGLAAHTHAGVIAMISLHLVQQNLLNSRIPFFKAMMAVVLMAFCTTTYATN